jgi:hypothetical protein
MQMQSVVVYKVCMIASMKKVVCSWIEPFAYNKLEHCCRLSKASLEKEYSGHIRVIHSRKQGGGGTRLK